MTRQPLAMTCEDADELAGLYVLGALETAEEAAIQQHLATCAQRHPQFAELGSVVPSLSRAIEAFDPPAELRTAVLAAVAATPQLAGTPQTSATPRVATATAEPVAERARPAAPISLAAERERRASRFGNVWRTAMAAAAVLLIVVLGATTVIFQHQASDADARANTLSAAITASLDPNSTVASLRGSGIAVSAAGFAAFPQNGAGFMVIHGLPAVGAGKTYEAWFITGSTPYPSVLLTPGADGLVIVQGLAIVAGADTMALTIEPASGSQLPTSAPIVVGKMQRGPVAGTPAYSASAPLH